MASNEDMKSNKLQQGGVPAPDPDQNVSLPGETVSNGTEMVAVLGASEHHQSNESESAAMPVPAEPEASNGENNNNDDPPPPAAVVARGSDVPSSQANSSTHQNVNQRIQIQGQSNGLQQHHQHQQQQSSLTLDSLSRLLASNQQSQSSALISSLANGGLQQSINNVPRAKALPASVLSLPSTIQPLLPGQLQLQYPNLAGLSSLPATNSTMPALQASSLLDPLAATITAAQPASIPAQLLPYLPGLTNNNGQLVQQPVAPILQAQQVPSFASIASSQPTQDVQSLLVQRLAQENMINNQASTNNMLRMLQQIQEPTILPSFPGQVVMNGSMLLQNLANTSHPGMVPPAAAAAAVAARPPPAPSPACPFGLKCLDADLKEKRWFQRYEELMHFHQAHGHCRVPHGYKRNPQLSWWVMNQRSQYSRRMKNKKSWLTDERMALLDALGFEWRPTEGRKKK